MNVINVIWLCLLFLIPIAALVFFIVSLVLYCTARRKSLTDPPGISPEGLKTRRTLLIVSGAIAGALLVVVIVLIVQLTVAIAYM